MLDAVKPNPRIFLPKNKKAKKGIYYVEFQVLSGDGETYAKRQKSTGETTLSAAYRSAELMRRDLETEHKRSLRPQTSAREAFLLKAHEVERLGHHKNTVQAFTRIANAMPNIPFSELELYDLNRLLSDYHARGNTQGSTERYRSKLRAAFTHANKIFNVDFAFNIDAMDPYQRAPHSTKWLEQDDDEEWLIRHAMAESDSKGRVCVFERCVRLLLSVGCRVEVIQRLTWDRIDLARGIIDLDFDGNAVATKNKKRPLVPVAEGFKKFLERVREENPDTEYYLGSDHVAIGNLFRKRLKGTRLEGYTPRTLRHTYASRAIIDGVNPAEVARVMGDDLQTVLRVYAKYLPKHIQGGARWSDI